MADASDSKSDEGDFVWVQVPSPAYKKPRNIGVFIFMLHFVLHSVLILIINVTLLIAVTTVYIQA